MNITVFGIGYVGLVCGTCFAENGHNVICMDNDQKKISDLSKGVMPLFEYGLEDMIVRNRINKSLLFTTEVQQALSSPTIIIIAVGTPINHTGDVDLQSLWSVVEDIGSYIHQYTTIVIKSTVPVGTADKVQTIIQKRLDQRQCNFSFDIVSNPEFLKEGTAVHDFMYPERIIIGTNSANAAQIMDNLYAPFVKSTDAILKMDNKSAEMSKYAANAMLATKISFINELAHICERTGADINKVRISIGSDSRIGYDFLNPGCGYGGSCLPKDIQALSKASKDIGYFPRLLDAVQSINNDQKHVLSDKVIKRFGTKLDEKRFAVWGLAFKPETDDMREASSVVIINDLTALGAKIVAYDPQARINAQTNYLKNNSNIIYANHKYEALQNADAVILVTEWKEFLTLDFNEMISLLKTPIFFDGRNQFDKQRMEELGFEYYQIGVIEQ